MADIIIVPGSSIMSFTSSLNYKQTLTQEASGSLTLLGSGSTGRTDICTVNGNNGTLFSVSDDLSDSLFSVNTIAGLPVIEAFADNTVKLGKYGAEAIVISGSNNTLQLSGSIKAVSLGTSSDTNVVVFNTSTKALSYNNALSLQGATGTQGIQGIYGAQGIQGAQGTQGIYGTQGIQGSQGTQGIYGAQGITGTGTQGIQGIYGAQGTTGATGTGTQGTTGTQGIQGIAGGGGSIPGSNNEILTSNGSGAAVAESNLTFDGSNLDIKGGSSISGYNSTPTQLLSYYPNGAYGGFFAAGGGQVAPSGFSYSYANGIVSLVDNTLLTNGTWGGYTYPVNGTILNNCTSRSAINPGDLICLVNDGKWSKVAANNGAGKCDQLLGICLSTATSADENIHVLIDGIVVSYNHAQSTSANPGAPLYIDATSAGRVSETAPSTTGDFVRLIGHNIYDTTEGVVIRFQPDNTWVEI
jgi:hypothetical protein